MGRLEATSLAYERSLLEANPAAARARFNIRHSITTWCFALVRGSDSAWLPPASEALGGSRGIGGSFRPFVILALRFQIGQMSRGDHATHT
jgi:hypothetical protein